MNAELTGPAQLRQVMVRGALPPAALAVLCLAAPVPLGYLLLMIFSLISSSWVHEAGHVLAYWRIGGTGRVVLRSRYGMGLSVAVPDPGRATRRVAAGGPLAACAVGLALLALGYAVGSGSMLSAGAAFGLHVLGLLPGCSDGNRLWGLDRS